ncbi:MAG: hypothetical protein ACYDEY_14930, partial [Acidimicrobiales bacterium]
RNPNPYPVVLMERVDATVHITPCSSNMAPDAPIMVNHRGAQHVSGRPAFPEGGQEHSASQDELVGEARLGQAGEERLQYVELQ